MPKSEQSQLRTFNILVLATGIFSMVVGISLSPLGHLQDYPLLFLVLLVAVLEFIPIKLYNANFSLIHIILFSAGLLYGTGAALIVNIVGVLSAATALLLFSKRLANISIRTIQSPWGFFFDFSLSSFSLLITLTIFGLNGGIEALNFESNDWWMQILFAGITFGVIHGMLYVSIQNLLGVHTSIKNNWDALAIVALEILPMYLGFISLVIYPLVGDGTILIAGITTFSIGLLIFYLGAPRQALERRLDELSALGEISRVLSSDIDLEHLLNSIQVQLTSLLEVDNFYVALLDPIDQQIWYPLAVKYGRRQSWSRRPLTDRLTDRVILEGKPILLPNNGQEHLSRIGLPAGENAPNAWIGVPLITSEQTIGCLALFSMEPETNFSDEDLNLLSILSGQTSVAIEIALHNALLSSDITIGRDRLTTILNSVNDGLILVDADGKISLVNEATTALTGLPQSELIGRSLPDLSNSAATALGFSDQDESTITNHLKADKDLTNKKLTYQVLNRSQQLFLERSIIPVQHSSNGLSGMIINLRDITDEYQLKQTQDLISETLVHDLRSPLSSTISALDVISDAQATGDPAGILKPSIQIAQRSSKRMLAMVESILEINRMESGRIELNLTSIDLAGLLQASIAEFLTLSQEIDVKIVQQPFNNLPKVVLDESKIHRVINNLIDNALKFSPEGEEILVKVERGEQDQVQIQVLDRGPGIPEKYSTVIFDRFFQIPGRSSRKRGSGLGLTYCRLVIEAHSGKIWVERRPSGGSKFIFSIPILGPGNVEF